MARYTTKERILEFCPKALQDLTAEYPDTYWTNLILIVSELVDAYIANGLPLAYVNDSQRLPDIDSDPATPEIVVEAASKFGHYRVNTKLKEINRGKGDDTSAILSRNSARKICQEIRDGEIHITIGGVDLTDQNIVEFGYETGPTPFTEEKFGEFDG